MIKVVKFSALAIFVSGTFWALFFLEFRSTYLENTGTHYCGTVTALHTYSNGGNSVELGNNPSCTLTIPTRQAFSRLVVGDTYTFYYRIFDRGMEMVAIEKGNACSTKKERKTDE